MAWISPTPADLGRVTVMGADSAVGASIVAAGAERGCAVLGLCAALLPEAPIESVRYTRHDLLDDPAPERLIEASDLLVLVLGGTASSPVEASDLHALHVIGTAARAASRRCRLLLAGRFDGGQARHDLVEYATVALCADLVPLPWLYVGPAGPVSDSAFRRLGARAFPPRGVGALRVTTRAYANAVLDAATAALCPATPYVA